ncbi:MAG: hypothetical protein IJ405_00935 [Lachnospiraceae bacterium]|nr:hypothetical protein [Lachnospiraceae bacterium]MBQ7780579.1 hypothetical protein [Lachnospiraceae bacterium]
MADKQKKQKSNWKGNKGSSKVAGKGTGKVACNTSAKEYRSFLYMLPGKVTAKELADQLDFLAKETVEVWTEVNLLELTLQSGTLTFEDMMEDLGGAEDATLLEKLNVKQVYACDYEASDAENVQKIMKCLIDAVGGFMASDTEDFEPFIKVEEL